MAFLVMTDAVVFWPPHAYAHMCMHTCIYTHTFIKGENQNLNVKIKLRSPQLTAASQENNMKDLGTELYIF